METWSPDGRSDNQKLDNFLAHYGVKGMRWGVRRSDAELARARGGKKSKKGRVDPDSEDVAKVKAAKATVARNKSTDPLSNQDLQALVTRLNLERQYSTLTAKPKGIGRKFVDRMIKDPQARKRTMEYANTVAAPVRAVIELRRDIERLPL